MTHQTITILFYASFLLIGLGIFLMIRYIMKRFPSLTKKVDEDAERSGVISVNAILGRVLFKIMPGILILPLLSIPTLYLQHLSKRFDYCVEMFRVNKNTGISKEDPDFQKRCKCLDLDEVQRTAETGRE